MWTTKAKNREEAILETMAWFSLFAYPPTSFEVWRFSFASGTLAEVRTSLDALERAGRVVMRDGAYVFPGDESHFDEREIRYRYSLPKLHKAERAAAWLSRNADVLAVFACNTLGLMHAREESDIDLLVIARHGAIARVRLWAVAPYALFGKRPKPGDERDAMCFSFFLTGRNLDVRRFALSEGDPYMAFWAATLLPLFDPHALRTRLHRESGVHELFPQFALEPEITVGAQRSSMHMPACLERPLRRFQERRFPESIRERIGQGTDVVVSDDAMKFHTLDRRAEYREAYAAKLKELGL